MWSSDEREKVKAAAAAQCSAGLNSRIGGLQQQVSEPAAPCLRERLLHQRIRAQNESRQLEQLHELEYLMDKHPEIARMLELLDSIRE